MDTLALHLRSWGNSVSSSAIHATLSSLAICHHIVISQTATIQNCASLLVCVGFARLALTIPCVPIDPSAKFRVKAFALRSSSFEAQCVCDGARAASSAVTAMVSGALTRTLNVSAQELAASAVAAARFQVLRPHPDTFEQLFCDLDSLASSICSIERVLQVCPIVSLQVRLSPTHHALPKATENCNTFLFQAESSTAHDWAASLPQLKLMSSDEVAAAKSWIHSTSAAIDSLAIKHAAYADVAIPAATSISMMRDGVSLFINEAQPATSAFEEATLSMIQFPWNTVTSDAIIQRILKEKAEYSKSAGGLARLRCIVEMLLAHTRRCCLLSHEHLRAGRMLKTLLEM
jgi:hypothetical protein